MFVALLCAPAAIRAQEGLPSQSDNDNGESRVPVFEFHSGFWVNLHHFLYEQGRLSSGLALTEGGGAGTEQTDALADLSGLTPAERADWKSAVAYYAAGISRGDLISDSEQSEISGQLSIREGCTTLSGPSGSDCQAPLPPKLVKALESAAPVYRARWWLEQDRANRAWIEKVAPLVNQMGVDLASQLADIFQEKWPAAKLRVDVVWYAGPLGAYTTLEPAHLTIASHDPRNQGLYSLEVLFQEASHTLAGGVVFAIQQECKRREMLIPRDLWHALLFYTTGEVVRRTLAQQGEAEYTPYAYRYGLYEQRWSDFEHVLAIYWQPYLDGKVDFDHAIEHVIAALA
ncbi:MAG: hypothetical protein ACLP1Y_05135 [Candidatus Acidiferrales bacterium]